MKIDVKLISGFLIITSFIGIVGYVTFELSESDLQNAVANRQVSLATEIIGEIDNSAYTRFVLFTSYTNDPIVQENIIQSNQEFAKLDNAQQYISEKDQEWISAQREEVTPFMADLINNQLAQKLKEDAKMYEKYYASSIPEIFITNAYGANVAQTDKTTDYKQDDEVWWQKAKSSGMYMGKVEYDDSAGVYSNDISIRIDDRNGNFLGVMKIVSDFEDELNTLNSIKEATMEHEVGLTLLDSDGKVIYSTEKTFTKGEIYRFFNMISNNAGYFSAREDEGGSEKLIIYVHSKDREGFTGLGGYLILEYDKDEVLGPIIKTRNFILSTTVVASAIAIGISILISRTISIPLKKLEDAADEIAQGNFDSKVNIKSDDEIGKLAESFNFMAASLKRAFTRQGGTAPNDEE